MQRPGQQYIKHPAQEGIIRKHLRIALRHDDAVKFLASSGLSPWAVSLGAAALFAFCLFLAWKKKIIQNYWAAVKE